MNLRREQVLSRHRSLLRSRSESEDTIVLLVLREGVEGDCSRDGFGVDEVLAGAGVDRDDPGFADGRDSVESEGSKGVETRDAGIDIPSEAFEIVERTDEGFEEVGSSADELPRPVLVHLVGTVRDDGSLVVRSLSLDLTHGQGSELAVPGTEIVLVPLGELGGEETNVSEVEEGDFLEGNETRSESEDGSEDEVLCVLLVQRKVDWDPGFLLHVDPELLDRLLLPLDVGSNDEDARSRVEEGRPISCSEDGDGVVEEREGDLGDGFGDEEEVGGVLKGSGRGEGSGELIASEREEEDSLDDFGGSSRERKRRRGRGDGLDGHGEV